MKKKFLAILLGILLVVTMLPVGSMAASTTNLLPNGDFEADFDEASNLPTASWAINYKESEGVKSSQVTADNGVAPAVEGSTKFLKVEWDKEIGGDNEYIFSYKIPSVSLEAGKTYALEYYVNCPAGEANQNAVIGVKNSPTSRTGDIIAGSCKNNKTLPTDGWVKETHSFQYDSANTYYVTIAIRYADADAVVYFDEVKLYEYVPVTVELYNHTFAAGAPFSTLVMNSAHVNNGIELLNFPQGSANYVLKSTKTDGVRIVANGWTPSGLSANDMVKLSWRLYIPAEEGVTEGTAVTVRHRAYIDTQSTFAGQALSVTARNQWIQFESYFNAPTTTFKSSYFEVKEGSAAITHYIDDIKLEKIVTEGYFSKLNVTHSVLDSGRVGMYSYTVAGVEATAVANTAKIQPLILYNPSNFSNKALALAAVYKNETGNRTLMDIKVTEVGRIPVSEITNSNRANGPSRTGIASAELAVDLSTLNLGSGDYEVEYFLWNTSGLAPITSSAFKVVNN